ncbi:MAG: GntR family transcriptional regulator [Clostridiales bacterium]|nr:GntR family transcriptional regulator [Clostridiales bacterium]
MSWNFDESRPLFQQIVERVTVDVVSGKYNAGDKLPSVREYAVEAGVNPNTMQKALSALEESGLIVTQRNSGRYVTENSALIADYRKGAALKAAQDYIAFTKSAGLTLEEAIEVLKEAGSK